MSDETRDENGRFAPGNSGGPGRPRRKTEAAYLRATLSRVSIADWKKVIDKALADALAGDRHARKFLAEYVLGVPLRTIELQGSETAALRDLLELVRDNGLSAGELFEALISEFSEVGKDGRN